MNPVRALIETLGVDYAQWRGLVRPLMNVSFRASQDSMQMGRRTENARPVSWRMMVLMLVFGLLIVDLAGRLPNAFSLSLAALTFVAATQLFLLLQNFQAVSVTRQDYEALGHRPVGPRTYLAARLTAIMAYQGIITALLAGPSILACGLRFGWLPAIALILAAGLLVFCTVLLVIAAYATLIKGVGAEKLARTLSYAQVVLLALYLAPMFFEEWAIALLGGVGTSPNGWILVLPTAWFAGLASLASGDFTVSAWASLFGVLCSSGGLAWFARDKLSLASAQKLGAAASESARPRSGRQSRVWFGRPRRLGWPATLAWGQLRHDMRLRMGAIVVLPLCAFYLVLSLQVSGPVDPFVPGASKLALFGIHASVLMAPVLLLEYLYASESWRAGWIFFATPADRARCAAQVRRAVTLFFFLPYLALAAIGLAWRFEQVWHALAHALLLGCLGLMIMQASQLLWPRLPFSLPHNRPRARLPSFVLLFGCMVVAGSLGFYAEFAYARPVWTIGTLAGAVLGAVVMERILPARLNRKLRWLGSEG